MSGATRLGGIHAVRAALEYTPERILRAWLDQQRRDLRIREIGQRILAAGIPLNTVNRKSLDAMLKERNHQGVVIEIRLPSEKGEKDLLESIETSKAIPFYLVLDQVQDPYNLGACLRTAEAAGVHGIVVPKDNAAGITPAVCKVASGAAEFVPIYRVINLSRTLQQLKRAGLWIVGAVGEGGQNAFTTDLNGPLALVIGAEGHGLRRLTREQCDRVVSLPMAGKVESLNLSVAAGILLYEAVRQRS
ncbi:MAG: 23S rRNA (guanosine(2251)-2'-O)-methyltransferase RlmB [Methylococcaceae bacterium]|nr:23S rRNA (guanosine(2251)-2'-O)-methyltransferase RlmB [Methylococcaceae bacterium]MCI0733527.1 23S rRNA (guanosine(2251)-2'-O)-methyltransferase RlmB [Methylococcaceae bacterium]